MKKIALLLLLKTMDAMVLAQESPVPAPIVIQPSDPMAWKISVSNAPSVPAVSAAIPENKQEVAVSLEHIRTGGLTKITINYVNGFHRDYWKAEHVVLGRLGNSNTIVAFSDNMPRYPYAASGFYGIENVRQEHAQGMSPWGGIPCQYYRGKRSATLLERPYFADSNIPLPELQYEAWFDAKTGLPKAYRADGKTLLFEFIPSPVARLMLPTEWQSVLDKYYLDLRRSGQAP